MCGYLIIIGIPMVIAFFIGRAIGDGGLLECRYRIVKRNYFEVHCRLSFWPFWSDICDWSSSLEEAKEKLKKLKIGKQVVHTE